MPRTIERQYTLIVDCTKRLWLDKQPKPFNFYVFKVSVCLYRVLVKSYMEHVLILLEFDSARCFERFRVDMSLTILEEYGRTHFHSFRTTH